jgi:hypothetical protein
MGYDMSKEVGLCSDDRCGLCRSPQSGWRPGCTNADCARWEGPVRAEEKPISPAEWSERRSLFAGMTDDEWLAWRNANMAGGE